MYSVKSAGAANVKGASPSFNDLTDIFVLAPLPGFGQQVLSHIPKAVQFVPPDKRRTHQKSRHGCSNCRRRRVKCTEEIPCSNCSRRGERCLSVSKRNTVVSTSPSEIPAVALDPRPLSNVMVNLVHIKLFHHFQSTTRHTLFHGPEVWEYAIQLSFHFEFLMNSILCISARHLCTLQPNDNSLSKHAVAHSCAALVGFRREISENFDSTNVDAFMATSLLLQYEIWVAEDDSLFSHDKDTVDRLFSFTSSLKRVCLEILPRFSDQPTKILPHLQQDPTRALAKYTQCSSNGGSLLEYREAFAYQRPLSLELLSTPIAMHDTHLNQLGELPGSTKDGYILAVDRLALILSFLPTAIHQNLADPEPSLLPALARYIMLFPVMCHGQFTSMVQQNDLHALLLLHHFYHAVRTLLPPSIYWWTQKRAVALEDNLKTWLISEIERDAR